MLLLIQFLMVMLGAQIGPERMIHTLFQYLLSGRALATREEGGSRGLISCLQKGNGFLSEYLILVLRIFYL